ncbi:MAG: acetylornithine/succinylornithine family transaminase [Eubacteriales bacterium]
MNVKELDALYVANTYARFPLEITSGKGSLLTGADGKEYIDLGTGIAVNTLGMSDPAWTAAVVAQLERCQHTSNLYYTEPCARLAQALCERTGMKRVFFSNSGAEANECAIKAARQYATKKGAGYHTVITLQNSFHGRTITTLAATGQEAFHRQFLPLTEGFLYTPPNDLPALRQLVAENKVAAVMFEVVQGEGGVSVLDRDFVQGMAELAEAEDILLIADEVQTGNGRTGTLYGYMQYGITPDIVTTAKGLSGGLPLGATLLGSKTAEVFTPGTHGSTFGGNPVCSAAALHVLSRIDDACLSGVRERSALIFQSLSGAKGIKSVSGLGLMIGVEPEKSADAVLAECMAKGVLVLKAKHKIRLLPALNIPLDLLRTALQVIKDVCAEGV